MPRRAVIELQGLYQVYAVDENNKVVVRSVRLGPVTGNDVVIEEGLGGGETIIVEGVQKVRPGMTVSPRSLAATQSSPIPEG